MTYREITKQLKQELTLMKRKFSQMEILLGQLQDKPSKKKEDNPLQSIAGIWKDKPRTKKDLAKVRKIIW